MKFREARRRLAAGNAEKIELLRAERKRIDGEIAKLQQGGEPKRLTPEEVADIVNVLIRFLRDIPVDLQELVMRERSNGEMVAERMQGGGLSVAEILSEYHVSYEDAFYESDDGRRFQDTFEALFVDRGKDEIGKSLDAMEKSEYFDKSNEQLLSSVSESLGQMYAGLNRARDQVRKSNLVISRLVRQQTDTRYVTASKRLGRLFVQLSEQSGNRSLKFPLPQGKGSFPSLAVSLRSNAPRGSVPAMTDAGTRLLGSDDIDAILSSGGPQVRKMLSAVREHPVMRGGKVDLAASYNELPQDYRRECEIAGFLGRFAGDASATSEWRCVSRGGTEHIWATSTLLVDADDLREA